MDDDQAQQIQAAVRAYCGEHKKYSATRPDDFPPLIASIQADLSLDEIADDELYCVVAMCILGPVQSIPPADLRYQLVELHRAYAGEGVDRAMEFTIAFGCGKWREPVCEKDSWYGIWKPAYAAVRSVMYTAVQECNATLSDIFKVPGFPEATYWKSQTGKTTALQVAHILAFQMIEEVKTLHLGHHERLWIDYTESGANIYADAQAYEDFLSPGAHTVLTLAAGDIRVEVLPDRSSNPGDAARFLIYPDDGPGNTPLYLFARDKEFWISRNSRGAGRTTLKPYERAAFVGPLDLELSLCNCGTDRCTERHRLSAWSPESGVSLWAFLKSAVKSPDRGLQAKGFAQGMYYGEICKNGIM